MKTLKNILKYVLGITSVLFLSAVIMGFYYTWKTGIIWTVGVLFLFTLFLTFTDNYKFNPENRIKRNLIRVLLYVLFTASFSWGNSILNENTEYKNYLLTKENKSNSEEITKEDIKTVTPSIDKTKLIEFQKKWSDSILKSENIEGKHLVDIRLVLPDTILFEYTEGVTKNNFETNIVIDTTRYRIFYKEAVKKELGNQFLNYKTFISCIPNQKLVSKQNNSIAYTHPALAFEGIKVYKGNKYYKEYIGKVKCIYKDEDKSFDDITKEIVIIVKGNNEITIPYGYFRQSYWTTKEENDITKNVNKCY